VLRDFSYVKIFSDSFVSKEFLYFGPLGSSGGYVMRLGSMWMVSAALAVWIVFGLGMYGLALNVYAQPLIRVLAAGYGYGLLI
jgi:hypothetical protein